MRLHVNTKCCTYTYAYKDSTSTFSPTAMSLCYILTDIDAWAIGISLAVVFAAVLIIVALVVGWRGCIVYKTKQKKKEESWKKQVQGTVIRPNPSYIEEDSSSD